MSIDNFWDGAFGDEYNQRNMGLVWTNTALFAKAMARANRVRSVIEFGAGTGQNLRAIHRLLPKAALTAVEINAQARAEILPGIEISADSITNFGPKDRTWDLVLTKGLLIHVPPEQLPQAYSKLYECASRYILLCEYHAPQVTMIPYRGHEHRLWKRDFASELLQTYPDLEVVDYGFQWKGDPNWPQDDITYFLLGKR